MYLEVKLCDDEGNEIEQPLCKCGNQSSTCIMGKDSHVWMCNACLYPEDKGDVQLIYKPFDWNLHAEKLEEKYKIAKEICKDSWTYNVKDANES